MAVKRTLMCAGILALFNACVGQTPTDLPMASEASLAKGGGGGGGTELYKVRFIAGIIGEGDGEITTDWVPAAGMSVSVNNPWRQIDVSGVTLNLNNYTHGDVGQGQCAVFLSNYGLPLNFSNWDIAGTDPVRSYAGAWLGSLTIKSGYLAFDGDRVVRGVVTPSAGGIHNVVTQSNAVVLTTGPNNDWFRQEVRNAPLKFGSASSPDGAPLQNAELACANYTVELRKAALIP